MRKAIPFFCYAAALIKTAHYVLNDEDADLFDTFETYYRDHIHTNMMVTLTIHPLYVVFRTIMRPFYDAHTKLMKDVRELSMDNAVSMRVLLTFVSFMCTAMWFGLATTMLFINTAESFMDLLRSAAFFVVTGATCYATMFVMQWLVKSTTKINLSYNHFSAIIHTLLLVHAAAVAFKPLRDVMGMSPIVLYTSVVLTAHVISYFFLRMMFMGYPRKHEKLSSVLVHAVIATCVFASSVSNTVSPSPLLQQSVDRLGLSRFGVSLDNMAMVGGSAFMFATGGLAAIAFSQTDVSQMVYTMIG